MHASCQSAPSWSVRHHDRIVSLPLLELPKHLTTTGLFPSLYWNYQNIRPPLDCFLPYIGITKTSDHFWTVSFPILELPKHLTTTGLFPSLYWNYQNILPLLPKHLTTTRLLLSLCWNCPKHLITKDAESTTAATMKGICSPQDAVLNKRSYK